MPWTHTATASARYVVRHCRLPRPRTEQQNLLIRLPHPPPPPSLQRLPALQVRFICGTQDIHKELEAKISAFHGTEDTILYASCFDANAGIFEVLLGPEVCICRSSLFLQPFLLTSSYPPPPLPLPLKDAVFSDELNHASIIDGIRLCKAQKARYKHRDMADLEAKLEAHKDSAKIKIIVTDGSNMQGVCVVCGAGVRRWLLIRLPTNSRSRQASSAWTAPLRRCRRSATLLRRLVCASATVALPMYPLMSSPPPPARPLFPQVLGAGAD